MGLDEICQGGDELELVLVGGVLEVVGEELGLQLQACTTMWMRSHKKPATRSTYLEGVPLTGQNRRPQEGYRTYSAPCPGTFPRLHGTKMSDANYLSHCE